jgi:hypothetical protein
VSHCFTPLSHGILSSVPDSAEAEAGGISNATRELGGVFGIAIGALVFQSGTAIQSPADFGTQVVPALFTGAAMIGLSLISVLAARAMALLSSCSENDTRSRLTRQLHTFRSRAND